MIIEFSVKNFRSLRDLATLSLEAKPLRSGKGCLISAGIDLLPTAGIFGHNASGKSNLARALGFMQWAMLNSDYLNQPITKSPLLQPFLLNETSAKEPSFFQVVSWNQKTQTEYRYGFEIDREKVVSEWLEVTSKVNKNRRQRMVFQRTEQTIEVFDEKMKKSVGHLVNNVLPTALALTVFAQFADATSSEVIRLMNRSSITIFDGHEKSDHTVEALQKYHDDPVLAKKVLPLLQKFDLGIQGLKVLQEPVNASHLASLPAEFRHLIHKDASALQAVTSHKVHGSKNKHVEFNFYTHESLGTRRLFFLAVFLIQCLETGGLFVFDEFGSSIHPMMSKEIVALFQNRKTNPNGAQLIFCSHETYLLSKQAGLRSDQIWFTEKNAREETVLSSLSQYKVRSECEFERNYRQGRFGGVPVIRP